VERPSRLPSAVTRQVIPRRAGLLAAAHGRVLDLSLVDSRAMVHRRSAVSEAVPSPADVSSPDDRPYDVVISTVSLVFFPDLVHALSVIERALAPAGELWLVEPTHHPGRLATVLATVWAAHPAVRGLHVERDVPAAIRASGLVLTGLERFDVPTPIRPLRRFVQGVARRDPIDEVTR
jgi:hypothetical protein